MVDAGESAWVSAVILIRLPCSGKQSKGALESALRAFKCAQSLMDENKWRNDHQLSFLVLSRLAALLTWSGMDLIPPFGPCHDIEIKILGQYTESDVMIEDCLRLTGETGEERAKTLRLRANNHWYRNSYADAIRDTLMAVRALGVEIDENATKETADAMFTDIKAAIDSVGIDHFPDLPRAPAMDLAIALLNDLG